MELRDLVTKLELPEAPADARPSWLTSWWQAKPSQKEEVAHKRLQHLLRIFNQLSGDMPYITRARWEQMEKMPATSSSTRESD